MRLQATQRRALLILALLFLIGPNGVFVWCTLKHWDAVIAALANPVALVFIVEAFFVMGLAAWWISRREWPRIGWKKFVVLSLLGGLGFSLPAFVWANSEDA